MIKLNSELSLPIDFHWCGKFTSPSPDWVHSTRQLLDYELFLVIEGTLHIADHENQYTLQKNEFLLMPPTHLQHGTQASDCTLFWFHFAPGTFNSHHCSQLPLSQTGLIPNIERVGILIHQLLETSRRYHHEYTLDLMATGILLELENQLDAQENAPNYSTKTRLYQGILDYIAWNKHARITIHHLADYFGYHGKYLSSIFKNEAGISLKQYLLLESMEYAKSELMNTTRSIGDIGLQLGYTDSHNFSHAFKKVTQLTPTEYRLSGVQLPKTP